jgi:hypothetical protein
MILSTAFILHSVCRGLVGIGRSKKADDMTKQEGKPWREQTRGEKLQAIGYIIALILFVIWFVYLAGMPGLLMLQ